MKVSELHNLYKDDYLVCLGCGEAIFHIGTYERVGDFDFAYRSHAKRCFALKRLIIQNRNEKASSNKISVPARAVVVSPQEPATGDQLQPVLSLDAVPKSAPGPDLAH